MSKETDNKEKDNRPDDLELETVLEQLEELQDENTDTEEIKAPKEKPKKKSKSDALKEEFNDLNDRFLRLAAEYDNYRKRSEKEKQASVSYGKVFTIEHMLPVLDVLETAAAAESADEEYKKGVEMTVALFKAAFEALGIQEIEAEGKPFDPELHCAVAQEQKEDIESGDVVTVIQKGYRTGDKVIRHSMVTVAE